MTSAARRPSAHRIPAIALVTALVGGLFVVTSQPAAAVLPDPLYEWCPGANSDEFDGPTLDTSIWATIVNPSLDRHSISDGHLVLPTYLVDSPDVPFIQQPVPVGPWEVTTEVTITPTGSFQQAGLSLWIDADNYAKVTTYSSSGTQRMQFTWRNAGVNRSVFGTDNMVVPSGTGATMWFRLTNDGTNIVARYSIDGATFATLGRPVPVSSFVPTHLGLDALRGATSTAPEIEAEFNWVRWTPTAAEVDACEWAALSDFERARLSYRDVLTGGDEFDPSSVPFADAIDRIDAAANDAWSTLAVTPSAEPWADLDTSVLIDMLNAYRRTKAMALAWATHGSSLEGNATLLADTIDAMDWLNVNRFNSSAANTGGWWFWEIGVPLEVNDITVLLFDELTPVQIDAYMDAVHRFTPSVTRTGANRVWASMVVALRGVIVEDTSRINAARSGVLSALDFSTAGDGFHTDGSFIQHNYYAYTGGYGLSMLSTFANLLLLLHDTPWALTDPRVANAYTWVTNSFEPIIYKGALFDNVRGRAISRAHDQDHDSGAIAMRAVLMLAQTAPAPTAAALTAVAKRWIQEDSVDDFWAAGNLTVLGLAQSAVDDPAVVPAPDLQGSWMFNAMDRAVHHGSDYAFAVSMSSNRIANYEVISGQNVRGWYTGEGMTALYTDDLTQFNSDFWATVNMYRLPGTTVDSLTKTSGVGNGYRSPSTFAGGVASPSGLYGVAGMALDSYGTTTPFAKKSWFFFDDEMVALGSGVTATGQTGNGWNGVPRHVETIVDNRKVQSGQVLTVDGSTAAATSGVEQSFTNPAWAHLSGASADVGYVLPGGEPLTVLREVRTGTWSTIDPTTGPTDTRTNTYVAMWVNHGVNPSNSTYSYVVLPNASAVQTQAYAATPEIQVLANTTSVSAVKETGLNVVGANFWTDAATTVSVGGSPFLTSNKKASIVTEETPGGIRAAVVDTTQSNTGTISVEIARSATAATFTSPGVTVTQLSPTIQFTVNVSGAKGAKFVAEFSY